jgi:hypothetical protein
MNKKWLLIFIAHCVLSATYAQTSHWQVDESEFQYSMTLVAKLHVDGQPLTHPNDQVGAFVGDKCRGVSQLMFVPQKGTYYAYLTVFSNTIGEEIVFKIFDSSKNTTTEVSKKIKFVSNQHLGNLSQSYSIAEPALNSGSEILRFNFKGVETVGAKIDRGAVELTIYDTHNLSSLIPEFELSPGAKLLKNKTVQPSGGFADNYSETVKYQIISEDESNIQDYQVSVQQTRQPAAFYRKNAVCYSPGAIKVVSPYENTAVKIYLNGRLLEEKNIRFGEAYFGNLQSGSYVVESDKEVKIIEVLLKSK